MRPAIVLLLLTACSSPEQATETTGTRAGEQALSQTAAQPAAETRGRFAVAKNGETILVEEFVRTSERLDSTLTSPRTSERATTTYTLAPDDTVTRVHVSTSGGDSDGEQITVAVNGGRATVSVQNKDGAREEKTVDVPPGTIPVPVNDSIVVIEQIIRRAKALGGSPVDVPVLSKSLQPERVNVTFGDGSATLRGSNVVIEAKLDGEGNLLSATETNQGLAVTRTAQEAGG